MHMFLHAPPTVSAKSEPLFWGGLRTALCTSDQSTTLGVHTFQVVRSGLSVGEAGQNCLFLCLQSMHFSMQKTRTTIRDGAWTRRMQRALMP